MATNFTFLVPLGWEGKAERLRFARARGLGVEITSFIAGRVLCDQSVRSRMEKELEKDLLMFPGSKTMHGVFLDIVLHSRDPGMAALAESRIEADVRTALRLGCEKVVFHLGFNPLVPVARYRREVLRAQEEYWGSILSNHPGIQICLENQWEPDWTLFAELFERVQHPRLGLCLDVGHAHVYGHFCPEAWIKGMVGKILHMHWNDNMGDRDSHRPLGKGNIDWPAIFEACRGWPEMTVTLEMNSPTSLERSLHFLSRQGLVPRWGQRDGVVVTPP